VNPGFGGQRYIPASTGRIRRLRRRLDEIGSAAWLEVDGGIDESTAGEAVAAGADVLVAGSAVFGGARSVAENVRAIRAAVEAADRPPGAGVRDGGPAKSRGGAREAERAP
jgi:ribulose-phosphate 3-epimerase